MTGDTSAVAGWAECRVFRADFGHGELLAMFTRRQSGTARRRVRWLFLDRDALICRVLLKRLPRQVRSPPGPGASSSSLVFITPVENRSKAALASAIRPRTEHVDC